MRKALCHSSTHGWQPLAMCQKTFAPLMCEITKYSKHMRPEAT